jgi:NADH-quinone oxidoreductase subunit B
MGLARGDGEKGYRELAPLQGGPTPMDRLIQQACAHSLWPLMLGLDYATLELYHAVGPRTDIARLGSEVFRPSPRQVDLLLIAGVVNAKMAPVVHRLFEAMAEARFVIACGAGAISGGLFADSYMVSEPLDGIVPVDVYIPGDPPRPEQILDGIQRLTDAIKAGEVELA